MSQVYFLFVFAYLYLSHARSAPPALNMMGITVASEWSFTFLAVRAPKHTLSASTTRSRHAACCAAVWAIGPPAAPAQSLSGGKWTISLTTHQAEEIEPLQACPRRALVVCSARRAYALSMFDQCHKCFCICTCNTHHPKICTRRLCAILQYFSSSSPLGTFCPVLVLLGLGYAFAG